MRSAWRISIFLATFLTIFGHVPLADAETPAKFLFVVESTALSIKGLLTEALPAAEKEFGGGLSVDAVIVEVDRDNVDASQQKVCAALFEGVTVILDMTWTGWDNLEKLATDHSIIYWRTDSTIIPFVQAMDNLLEKKNATDVALIFENERDLNQSLYYLIGHSIIRLVVIDELSEATVAKVRAMRPPPSYYAICAKTSNMETLFQTAIDGGLVKRNGVWNLVFTDLDYKKFKYISDDHSLNLTLGVLSMKPDVCCRMIGENPCNCPADFEAFPFYFKRLIALLVSTLSKMAQSGQSVETKSAQCDGTNTSANASTLMTDTFTTNLISVAADLNDVFEVERDNHMIYYKNDIELETLQNGVLEQLGNWSRRRGIQVAEGKKITPAKRYFRVGTTEAVPWTSIKRDPTTNLPVKDAEGNEIWEGYCIDFIQKLSEEMNFEYDLVIPTDRAFGVKSPDGKWTGLVGDLARGDTDIVIGALTMTSEREDNIDFVAPYFAQSGLLIGSIVSHEEIIIDTPYPSVCLTVVFDNINCLKHCNYLSAGINCSSSSFTSAVVFHVMRKPVRKTSLFKFMTVLRLEVWLSIVCALTLTGIMIWILDKYSPYSARNNKKIYPYPCREFTLKESFWFALTSFTPQGGGEAPKALSSRTLVAAYWLFVVLMLATFTANLAAFLTVERMQSPVQSLEQLARQSRINYTVLINSSIHQYFINMKKAEDKLYNVWKEITLNSTSDQIEYRVWDYPIKEQYGHILQAITQVGPVSSAAEGFQKVIASESAEFAFIHDSAEIKYEVTRNCNLTEVGETFAEQPYAIAVQQGSHLQEEISRKILDLQKDRYFERLSLKYWNTSMKGQCPNSDDNEGITLESLGGVFIATLFGLALAMITLAGEVIYYRRRNAQQLTEKPPISSDRLREFENEKSIMEKITANFKMKPAPTVAFVDRPLGPRARVSHISVYPRHFPFKD